MASHEETPSLSLRNGFRCVPEDGVTVENVLISTGGEVGHENIVSASRMNRAVVVFLKEHFVNQLIKNGLVINDNFVQVTPLQAPTAKITVSNVPPFIPDDALERELVRFGKFASGFKIITLGCKHPSLRHVKSFRRQAFMFLDSAENTLEFLEYQQIKSIVKRKFKSNHINLQIPPSVSDFLNLKTPKLMSKIYRALSKIDESVSLPIAKWEADLSVSWDHNFWSQICLKTFELIRNPGLQLIQYKILHRVHYTGLGCSGWVFTASNNCSHCKGNTPDNYIHALWFCPPVQRYWYRICEGLIKVS